MNNSLSSITHISGLYYWSKSVYCYDLMTVSAVNLIFKYADDTTLLVPQITDTDVATEFSHIMQWATTNRLRLNLSKTKENVFKNPRVQYFHMPVDDIEQLNSCKLLGVIFQSNLKMNRMYFLYHLSVFSVISRYSCYNCFADSVCTTCLGRFFIKPACC